MPWLFTAAAAAQVDGPAERRNDATLVVMNDNAHSAGRCAGDGFDVDDPRDRLANPEARTEIPMDLLALVTLWLVLVPPWDFGHDLYGIAWTARIAVSVVYGIDLAIRSVLSRSPVRYVLAHPVVLASVLYPPVRVVFSVRLVRSMFRRGNLLRFLLAASVGPQRRDHGVPVRAARARLQYPHAG